MSARPLLLGVGLLVCILVAFFFLIIVIADVFNPNLSPWYLAGDLAVLAVSAFCLRKMLAAK